MTTQTLERSEGLEALNQVLNVIKESIEESGGMFNIKLQVSRQSFFFMVAVDYSFGDLKIM